MEKDITFTEMMGETIYCFLNSPLLSQAHF